MIAFLSAEWQGQFASFGIFGMTPATIRFAVSALRFRFSITISTVTWASSAFSTRAESISNHKAGVDVIGMTNLGEAKCAREAEIAYATMAMITDYDCWKADEDRKSVV